MFPNWVSRAPSFGPLPLATRLGSLLRRRLLRVATLRLGCGLLALGFLMADDGISPDEFQCEVAVGRLADCCPDFPAGMLSCVHGGCDSDVRPDLSPDRASCIQSKSCDELMALGACDSSRWEAVPSCTPPCSTTVPPCH